MFCTKQRTEDDLSWLEKLAEGSHSQLLSFPKLLVLYVHPGLSTFSTYMHVIISRIVFILQSIVWA